MSTEVSITVECILQCRSGRGLASFSRTVLWPGVPAVGQTIMQSELPWTVSFNALVRDVVIDLDVPGRVEVCLEEVEWDILLYRSGKPTDPVANREHFMECVEYMREAEWSLDRATWFPTSVELIEEFGPKPPITEDDDEMSSAEI